MTTTQNTAGHCEGCDQHVDRVRRYVVTRHDGSQARADYCGECADLAAMDWNHDTAKIAPDEER